ncbi:tRNA threonylcarbamoyl adenosine modification protein (Sua5/YciO/YrdC/YwlC family) [Natronospira proteinivora]|uniref:tRNA threonylcarbamoyl adenosine modification protein (Sua5/YciO/YrdC/YwlC family) n=1 Tax=Natronospira proteinivora TaxID=1807133 RepID=A0ABT1G6L4_9GAMM|nr:L-threonylcarbamoyladenylate synthase [Natronospira proteinivora]MCP1726949.1 tRNA threonylcarbamoyl adenosine modification protein (Sua5/YciO/YrdC/YwlC family) [Natronospira proteinivora]
MSQFFQIHPVDPQPRLIKQAVRIIRDGGVVVYPTDSIYALGCGLERKPAVERIQWLRQMDKDHNFTLVCRDLSDIGTYARVDNVVFRLLKAYTPGPYTFILKATGEVPRRLQNPKRKTIGIRVPDNAIVRALLEELGEPILSSTLLLPDDELPLSDPENIRDRLEHHVDLIIDGGNCGLEPSTVVDLSDGPPRIRRHGRGDPAVFET